MKPIRKKEELFNTSFKATDQISSKAISSELMMIQSLLMYHYGFKWAGENSRPLLLYDNDQIVINAIGVMMIETAKYPADNFTPLTLMDIMPNQYRGVTAAPEPAPVANAGRKAQIIREALITCRDEVKRYLQQPLIPDLSATDARIKLQEYTELIAEISGYDQAPAEAKVDPLAPYVLAKWSKRYSQYVFLKEIRSDLLPVEMSIATRYNSFKEAADILSKYKQQEKYEPLSLSFFDTVNQ